MQTAKSLRPPGFMFGTLFVALLLLPASVTRAQGVDLGAVLAAPRAMDLVPVEAVPFANALQPEGCVVPAKPTLSRSPSSVAVGGQVTLSWSPDPFITATYIPYAATSSGGPWSPLLGTPMTGTSINVNMNVTAGTYYFFVRAIGTCDLYVDSNVVSVTVTGSGGGGGGCVGPPTPTLSVSSSSVTVGQTFTLSWSADPYGTTEYWWLGVNSAPSGTFQLVSTYSGGTTSAAITATSANAGQTLYFRVWAYPYGGSTCEGLRTNSNAVAVSVTTGGGGGGGCVGPPTPTLSVNPASVAVGQTFTLSWSADPYGTTDHWWLGVNSAPTGTFQLVSTYSPGTTSASITASAANAGQTLYFRVWAYPYGGSTCEGLKTNSNAVSVAVTSGGGGGGGGACTPDATSLCLFGNRFRVQATYRDYGGNTGSGKAVSLTGDSGYFWFFTSSNVEIVAKLVSFCNGSSGNYGVYLSGLTDVQVSFTVTDTKTGTSRSYNNPLGSRFCTIGDPWTVCP
ncbi:MAG: hypothetical protein JNK60_01325 [Acidobacteria bacterium]|nr:hypothetical protein [Acidobacteriota bacterium]